jgi:hypothetical protein
MDPLPGTRNMAMRQADISAAAAPRGLRRLAACGGAAAVLALAACGGGDGTASPPESPAPGGAGAVEAALALDGVVFNIPGGATLPSGVTLPDVTPDPQRGRVNCNTQAGAPIITLAGTPVTREFNLSGFDQVEANCVFEVEIREGADFSVSVSADTNLIDRVQVSVANGTLGFDLQAAFSGSDLQQERIRATVVMPALGRIGFSGASSAALSGFASAQPFSAVVSGVVRLSGDLTAGDTGITAVGASRAALSGAGQALTLVADGVSDVDLGGYAVGDANLVARGVATVQVRPAGRLDVDAAGVSKVFFFGNPTLGNIVAGGLSKVTRAGD